MTGKSKSSSASASNLRNADICFVVDCTGSMGAFIKAAKSHLVDALGRLSKQSTIDLQSSLVMYRDHPPEDNSFITKVRQLSANARSVQHAIDQMSADGGGDEAEAVYRGLFDAANLIKWRPSSCRFILLVGDAPPHGYLNWYASRFGERLSARGVGDRWPGGCPSSLDPFQIAAAAEKQNATINSICMSDNPVTASAFSVMAKSSGGKSFHSASADKAITNILDLLAQEFKNLDFDEEVLAAASKHSSCDPEVLSKTLGATRIKTSQSVSRLGRRGFLVTVL